MNTISLLRCILILQTSSLQSADRNRLDQHSHIAFIFLCVATGIVGLGIFFEWPEVKEDIQEWWISRPSRRPSWMIGPAPNRRSIPVWSLIGFLLVAGGVAAEGAFETLVGMDDTEIRQIDELQIAQLQKENLELQGQVGGTAEKLRLANDRFAAIEERAGALDKQLDAADKQISAVEKDSDLVQYVLSAKHIQDEIGIETELRNGFKGSHIVFSSYWDDESIWLCNQLVKIADKAEVGPVDKCGDEPLVPGLPQLEDLYLEGPDHEQLNRLSTILKKPKRVPGIFVGMREQPTLKVLVGLQRKIWLEHQLKQQPKSRSTTSLSAAQNPG